MTCSHKILRASNNGLCPICHAALCKLQLTPHQLAKKLHYEAIARKADKCKASLARFFRESWPVLEPSTPLQDSWHFDVLAMHLEKMFRNWQDAKKRGLSEDAPMSDLQNLLVNVPPGTAKSRFISVCFPAWVWLQEPTFSIVALSANPNVAKRDADFVRQLIDSEWYQTSFHPTWEFREDKNAVGYFQIADKRTGQRFGWRRSFSLLSAVIGERSDCIILDDPHDPNDKQEALQRAIEKWGASVYNRTNNPAVSLRIAIMQRVHHTDISADMLAHPEQKWLHLCIPLTRKETQIENAVNWRDPREVGKVLMPLSNTKAVIEAERTRLNEIRQGLFDGMYEQEPPDFSGATFESQHFRWFRFADDIPMPVSARPTGSNDIPAVIVERNYKGRYFDDMCISVDSNFAKTSVDAKGSRIGILLCGNIGFNRFIVEDYTAAIGFKEVVPLLKRLLKENPEVTRIYIEDKASGNPIMVALEEDISEIYPVTPTKEKEVRARACIGQVTSHRVWFREAPWNKEFCAEIYSFPYTKRNDRVDTLSQYLFHAREASIEDKLNALADMS